MITPGFITDVFGLLLLLRRASRAPDAGDPETSVAGWSSPLSRFTRPGAPTTSTAAARDVDQPHLGA